MPEQDERRRINEQEAIAAAEREKQRAERMQQAKQEQRTADTERSAEPVKSDKLLPFLNAAHERYTSRVASLNGKKQTRLAKIGKNAAKEERLSAKADRMALTNEMLRRLTAGTRLEATANAIIGRNQQRIDKIRNEKIPKIEDKIAAHGAKVREIDKKIAAQQRKADKCVALSNVITSFVILDPVKRRAQFSQSMDTLHRVTMETLAGKVEKYTGLNQALQQRIQTENISQSEYARLTERMKANLERVQEAKAKMKKLDVLEKPYAEQDAERQDMLQALAESQLDTAAQRGETRINPLTETLCVSAAERVLRREMTKEDFEKLRINRDNDLVFRSYLDHESGDQSWYDSIEIFKKDGHFYEKSSEGWNLSDTFREITGEEAIKKIEEYRQDTLWRSTLKVPQPEQILTELLEQTGYKQVPDSPFAKDGLIVLRTPDGREIGFDGEELAIAHLSEVAAEQQLRAVFSVEQNGETRYFEAKSTNIDDILDAAKTDHPMIAAEIIGKRISEAEYAEIEQSDKLSASVSVNVNLGIAQVYEINNGKGGIREENRTDQNVRISTETLTSVQKFNPEYFQSLPRADRLTDTRTHEAALKIMDELDQQGIPFSAVFRNNGTASVTVNEKLHGAVYLNAVRAAGEPLPAQQKQQDITVRTPEAAARITKALDTAGIQNSSVRQGQATVIVTAPQDRSQVNAVISGSEQQHRKQFINPETYKQIPKEERFTKRMPEAQAREAVEQLAAKGVPHSAVLDGARSAVTVEKKSKGFVLGKQQRNDIASRAAQAKHQPAKNDSPAKQQEIG